jgi:hypothetical protein
VQASVFNGEATLAAGSQFVRLKKNDTLTVDANNPAGYIVAKGVDSVPLDRWNSERRAYQDAYSYNNNGYQGLNAKAYGLQDLGYYGGFMNVPGYGLAWQPYGASNWMGWDPYNSGSWVYTGGFGYAWASAYPWGWLPYHYGSWVNTPAYGWFWVPGNSFGGGGTYTNWQATAPVVKAPPGYTAPTAPSVPLAGPRPTIMVGRIGNSPAYLPDGRVPPNFRSVIQDHSGLVGTTNPSSFASGGQGANGGSQNARSMNAPRSNAVHSGHVFVAPPPAASGSMPNWTGGGFGSSGMGGGGMGSSAQHSSAPMHSGSGGTHASGTASSHGGTSSNPK